MTHWANFDPATDHFVQGFANELPVEGEIQVIMFFEGDVRHEQVVAAWWDEDSTPDPLFHDKRRLSLITRPVT